MRGQTHRRRAGYTGEQERLLMNLFHDDLIKDEKFRVSKMRERLQALSTEQRLGLDEYTEKQLMDKLRFMKKNCKLMNK